MSGFVPTKNAKKQENLVNDGILANKSPTLSPTYTVLLSIEQGITTIPKLSKLTGKHRSTIHELVNKCFRLGYLEKLGKNPIVWNLTGKGKIKLMRLEKNVNVGDFSLRVRAKKIRVHKLVVKFDLLDDSGDCVNWSKVVRVNNWFKRYVVLEVDSLTKVTVEKTTKSVVLYCSVDIERRLDFNSVLMGFLLRVVRFCDYWLVKRGVRFDDQSGVVLSQHLAFEEKSNGLVDSKSQVEVDLNRRAESVFSTGLSAKAWLDWSKAKDKSVLDIESNDLAYNEKLVLMPEKVHTLVENQGFVLELSKNLGVYNENVKLHMKVMRDIRKGIRDLVDVVKELKEVKEK